MKVSVITPSLNQSSFIARTLQSVAIQTEVEVEHIVVDGGSQDQTVTILQGWRPRVTWISEKDKGQAHALNKGIRMSSGEIIGWLNSDDIYYPNALTKAVKIFQDHPEIGIVYGSADHINERDEPFEEYPTESWSFCRLKEICFISQPAAFFRRTVFDQHGPLDESLSYCMDYEYWLRLGAAGVRFHYTSSKLAGSRLYEGAKTLRLRVAVHTEINDMLGKKFGTVSDRWLRGYAHVVAQRGREGRLQRHLFRLKKAAWYFYALVRWRLFPQLKKS